MQTLVCEIHDLALTQALERYIEMTPHSACEAIMSDHPHQTAVLLIYFLFSAPSRGRVRAQNFVHRPRAQGTRTYIDHVDAVDRLGCQP